MTKKAIGLTLIAGLVALLFYPRGPTEYQLTVINNTQSEIALVRVFGTGASGDDRVTGLQPGDEASLKLILQDSGDLRFEVIRGLNRIDSIFEEDVASLASQQMWLEINENNHFVISRKAPD